MLGGIFLCVDVVSGEVMFGFMWVEEFEWFYVLLVVVNGYIYFVGRDGIIVVYFVDVFEFILV